MLRKIIRMTETAFKKKMERKGLTEDGSMEIPNPTPMAPPVGYRKLPSMVDHVREAVRSEMFRRDMERQGKETFEEADDFEVEDDPFPVSMYDNEGEIPVRVLLEEGRKAIKEKQQAAARARAEKVAEPPLKGPKMPASTPADPLAGDAD